MRRQWIPSALFVVFSLVAAVSVGCSKKQEPAGGNEAPLPAPVVAAPAPSQQEQVAHDVPAAPATPTLPSVTGTIGVSPSPVPVCAKTGHGVATISWTLAGTTLAEIHMGSPDGSLFLKTGGAGSQKTGDWVAKGTTFYLQNVVGGAALTEANTLAKLTVETVPGPCP